MKMVKFRKTNRKAISPIIATVLIIAVTLIAAVAIGGFVFGLFGASSNTAQVQAISSSLSHTCIGTGCGSSLAVTCGGAAPAGYYGSVVLSNTGTANTAVTSISITYSGNTYSLSLTSPCAVNAGTATTTLWITGLASPPSTGGPQFSGYVVTTNGAQVVFTNAFS